MLCKADREERMFVMIFRGGQRRKLEDLRIED